jgi:glyoxylase I family protein
VLSLRDYHHVALTVRDLDASAEWYMRVLGFREAFREDGEGRRAMVLRFPVGNFSLGLVEHRSVAQPAFDPRRPGLDHVAFNVATRADLDEWAAHLTAAGIAHSGVIDIPPGGILNFKDPDGLALALFWDRG